MYHKALYGRRWTQAGLIDWCLGYLEAHEGQLPTQNILRHGRHMPSPSTIDRHFGSLTAYFYAVKQTLASGTYPSDAPIRKQGSTRISREDMIDMGVAYVKKEERYPDARKCLPCNSLPSASSVHRHFGLIEKYHAAIYAADHSLPPPPLRGGIPRRSTRPTKYRLYAPRVARVNPADKLAGEEGNSSMLRGGEDWLGGVDLTADILSGGDCACTWCHAYKHDPARHCVCGDPEQRCKACYAYERDMPMLATGD